MPVRLRVTLDVRSDFHVGTGTGIGGVVDAAVRLDAQGRPIIPGSTLKGLARHEAMRLAELHPALAHGQLERVFGVPGKQQGSVCFGNALPAETWQRPRVHGRSARDRRTGRPLEDHLFRMQDAATGSFRAEVTAEDGLSEGDLVLLVASLRRVRALGGQRRRGKGRVEVHVEILEGPQGWKGTRVPGDAARFEEALRTLLTEGAAGASAGLGTGNGPSPESRAVAERSVQRAGAGSVLLFFARAETPLALPAAPDAGNVMRTLPHVTGGSLRGALAAWLQRHAGFTQDFFDEVFLREGIHFGPLYPVAPRWDGRKRTMPLPAPRSLLCCKLKPGIRGMRDAHGVVDVLRERDPLRRCSRVACGAALVPLGGYLQVETQPGVGVYLLRAEAAAELHQHVEIDFETQRAAEGRLFSVEALPTGTWLAGYLWGDAALLDALQKALPREGALLSVGRGRTRGYGGLRVFARVPGADDHHPVFPWVLPRDAEAAAGDDFTLTLYSDLVALDALLRPVTLLDETALWALLGGHDEPPFRLVRGYAATRRLAGFNSRPRRPRSPDLALAAGSTFLYRWTADSNSRDAARGLLAKAQERGLGLRRGEGLGRVVINLPLHAVSLDQAQAGRAELDLSTPSGFPADLPPVPPPPGPAPDQRWSVPEGLDLEAALPADRIGLARLLASAAREEDPIASLRAVLERRKRRKDNATDTLLQRIVDRGCDKKVLESCARRLLELEARERLR